MIFSDKGLKNFEECGVRAFVRKPITKDGRMICVSHSEGFNITLSDLEQKSGKKALAKKLGCVSCPNSCLKLEFGEIAAEGVLRIANQKIIDDLDGLFYADAAIRPSNDPPGQPGQKYDLDTNYSISYCWS